MSRTRQPVTVSLSPECLTALGDGNRSRRIEQIVERYAALVEELTRTIKPDLVAWVRENVTTVEQRSALLVPSRSPTIYTWCISGRDDPASVRIGKRILTLTPAQRIALLT